MENNKGFSLVELIVAMAVLAIAGIGIFGFAVYSSNHYQKSNEDVKLQYEQQLAVNQIRDAILEATSGIYYEEPTASLFIYSQSSDGSGNTTYPVTRIRFDSVSGHIYVAKVVFASRDDIDVNTITATDDKLLAEDVSAFTVDLSKVAKEKVGYSITFTIGTKVQTVSPVVALRNHIQVSNVADSIYTGMGPVVSSFIRSVAIQRGTQTFAQNATDVIRKSGDSVTVRYTALVTGTQDSTREYAVQWSTTATNSGISITSDGAVTVNSTVLNGTEFSITATSIDDPTKYATLTIRVEDGGIYPETGTIAFGATTSGNGYVQYEIIPTITYTDGSVSHDANLLTWRNVDNLPTGCVFSINEDTGYGELYLTSGANGHNLTILAVTKEMNVRGEAVITNELELSIGENEIPEYVSGPALKLNVPSDFQRGGIIIPSVILVNAPHSDYTYHWTVEPVNGEADSSLTNWIAESNTTRSFNNITLNGGRVSNVKQDNTSITCTTSGSYRSINLISTYLISWQSRFRIRISVYAENNKDHSVTETQTKYVDFVPAKLSLEPAGYVEHEGSFSTDSEIILVKEDKYNVHRYFYMTYEGLALASNFGSAWNWVTANTMYYKPDGHFIESGTAGFYERTYLNRRVTGFYIERWSMGHNDPRPAKMKYSVTIRMPGYAENTVTSDETLDFTFMYEDDIQNN